MRQTFSLGCGSWGGNATNTLTGAAYGTPTLTESPAGNGEFVFAFPTIPGVIYTVEFKNSLTDPLWQTLTTVTGDGSVMTITNLTALPAQRFYRLSVP